LSARASTLGGIVRPICFAVFRLKTNSNFIARVRQSKTSSLLVTPPKKLEETRSAESSKFLIDSIGRYKVNGLHVLLHKTSANPAAPV
jgi:hypothetical protein